MKSFREKYPGLTEEQLRIKYKIWQREKERERLLNEAEEKKKIRDPFSRDDDDGETGAYDGALDIDQGNTGVVSDAAIEGAQITFMYPPSSGGLAKYTTSDSNGKFLVPRSFGSGTIIINSGIDSIIKVPYRGQFVMDGIFFHNYRAVTPLSHITNHIWNLTPTRVPEEAMYLVLDYIFDFIGIPHSNIKDIEKMFNDDHVKLTLDGLEGAKEIQAINTLIEVHADLISGLKANNPWELEPLKIQTYTEIGNALLTRVNGQESRNYFNNIFNFHISGQEKSHDKCCLELLERASDMIKSSLAKDHAECTSDIQSINLMVKDEWTNKALEMTSDPKINSKTLWEGIENKTVDSVSDKIDITAGGGLNQ